MKSLKQFLDWISPQAPPPDVQEAESDNITFDQEKLDSSLKRLLQTQDEFAEIVSQVVHDVNQERRLRRANEKVATRTGKT